MTGRAPLSAIQMLRSDGEAQHVTSIASPRARESEVRGPAGGHLTATGEAGAGTATGDLAARLDSIAEQLATDDGRADILGQLARKLRRCIARDAARDRVFPPCGHALCPACQATKAKQLQSDVTRQLRATAHAKRHHVRLSVVGFDDLATCHAKLTEASTLLRRDPRWRSVVAGGAAFVDLLDVASDDAATRWNPHAHSIIELRHGTRLRCRDLDAMWTKAVTSVECVGSFYLGPVYAVPERDERFRFDRSPQGFYVTRRDRARQLARLDDEQLVEAVLTLRRLRAVTWFGTWRGLSWRTTPRKRQA